MTTDLLAKAQTVKDLRRQVRDRAVGRWWNDPAQWVADVVPTAVLAPYQTHELDSLTEHGRVAARGPRGSGKTMPASLAVLWFATTRELAGADWKVPSTAPAHMNCSGKLVGASAIGPFRRLRSG